MKSTLILISLIGLMLISDINPAFAVADSCLKMVYPHGGWYSNIDSVMIDRCKGSPTYGMWFAKKTFFFVTLNYMFQQKPIPKGELKTWNDIDTVFSSTRQKFYELEQKYGKYHISRYPTNISDSNQLRTQHFTIEFENYVLVDSVVFLIYFTENIDVAYLLNPPIQLSKEDDESLIDVLLISPNPSSDFIEISVGANGRSPLQIDVRIFDVYGQTVSTPNPTPSLPASGEGVRIDVSSLPPGMYFVRIGDRVRKFVKL